MLATILETVRARLGVATTAWLIGAHKVQQNARPPRYVWIPGRDKLAAPERAGGRPRALYTRQATVDCHLWGTDLADAENRLHALIAAMHAEARTSFAVTGADWDQAQANEAGQLVVVSFAIEIPVTDATLTTATTVGQATAYTVDGAPAKATGDGFLDSDE